LRWIHNITSHPPSPLFPCAQKGLIRRSRASLFLPPFFHGGCHLVIRRCYGFPFFSPSSFFPLARSPRKGLRPKAWFFFLLLLFSPLGRLKPAPRPPPSPFPFFFSPSERGEWSVLLVQVREILLLSSFSPFLSLSLLLR